MTFSQFHFIFLYFWITKRQKLVHHKFRLFRKEGAVFWDNLPRGVRISTKKNVLEEQGLSFFFRYKRSLWTPNSYDNPCFFVWLIYTTFPIRHFCCYSNFSRQKSKIWSGPMSRERLYIPDLEPDHILSNRGRCTWARPDLGPYQIFGTKRYHLRPYQIFGTKRYHLHNCSVVL